MNVHWPIIRKLLAHPRRVAVTDDKRSYRGLELVCAAMIVASEIERCSKSKTIGLLVPTSGAMPIAALAGWILGRTVVPLNYLLKREELQYVIDDCGADCIVASRALLDHLGYEPEVDSTIIMEDIDFRVFPELRWPALASEDDLAVLLYTSGTSGRPKGVMLTHANLASNIQQIQRWVPLTNEDLMMGVLPQFHSFGLTVLTLLPLTVGVPVVYTARFMPQKIVQLCKKHRPTMLVAIPSMYNALLSVKKGDAEDFSSLRITASGGEPLPDDVARRFRERFGVTIAEGYGLTETSPVTNWCRPDEFRSHTVGMPLPDIEQEIRDLETDRPLPPGRDGEIVMRGPNIMRGYLGLAEETTGVFDDAGFFRSGDIGRFDRDGFLYITGRLKEMMIVGGENVFPREIEEVLNACPDVLASAVVGLHDPVRGEVPVAFYEAQEDTDPSESELKSWCRDRIAGYKVPREMHRVDELPRNPTGKILRRELQERVNPKG